MSTEGIFFICVTVVITTFIICLTVVDYHKIKTGYKVESSNDK